MNSTEAILDPGLTGRRVPLPIVTADSELVARFLRGETDAVETVDEWIASAAWPYQRRLADR